MGYLSCVSTATSLRGPWVVLAQRSTSSLVVRHPATAPASARLDTSASSSARLVRPPATIEDSFRSAASSTGSGESRRTRIVSSGKRLTQAVASVSLRDGLAPFPYRSAGQSL